MLLHVSEQFFHGVPYFGYPFFSFHPENENLASEKTVKVCEVSGGDKLQMNF